MSLTVLSGIPPSLVIGDSVSFKVSDSVHPAGVWTSQILFKNGNLVPTTFDGAASGTDHLFELTNANTATLLAGRNLVCLVFSDGTNRQSSAWQEVQVLANPTLAGTQTYAQRQVELLQGAIAKLNASPRNSVSFNGQSFQRANIEDYRKQLVYWESRVAAEQPIAGSNSGPMRRIPIQFVNNP